MRNFLSVIAGLITAIIVISIIERIGLSIFPPPSDFDFSNKEAVRELLQNAPTGSLLFVILAWALGSLLGGLVSSLISNNQKMKVALITGGILFIAGLINLITLPHPIWFWIVGLSVYFPFAYLGGKLGTKWKSPKSKI